MECPLPVVAVKRALDEAGSGVLLSVIVDDGAARENVVRFARNRGYDVSESVSPEGVLLRIADPEGEVVQAVPTAHVTASGKPVLVTSDRLGDGPEDLGRLLLKNFLITLLESPELPDKILFLNRGVLLATEGSELLEVLAKLEHQGVEVFSCGVCLDYFDKRESLRAGGVTNMFSIVEALMKSGGTIRL